MQAYRRLIRSTLYHPSGIPKALSPITNSSTQTPNDNGSMLTLKTLILTLAKLDPPTPERKGFIRSDFIDVYINEKKTKIELIIRLRKG